MPLVISFKPVTNASDLEPASYIHSVAISKTEFTKGGARDRAVISPLCLM